MIQEIRYNTFEEMLNYFVSFLPEPSQPGIASVVKYARINDEEITLKAVKERAFSGLMWKFEITVGAGN
jgi:hypothetical protein